jgi:hypothetical protein
MKFSRGRLMTLTAAALIGSAFAAPAALSAPTSGNACENGGYSKYTDPAANAPFKNEGKCKSFVAAGGVLTPVGGASGQPLEAGKIDFAQFSSGGASASEYSYRVVLSDWPADTVLAINEQAPYSFGRMAMTQPDGTLVFVEYGDCQFDPPTYTIRGPGIKATATVDPVTAGICE